MRQRALDRGAIFRLHRLQHRLLVGFLQILNDRNGVVGVQLGREFRHLFWRQRADQVVAHIIIEFGKDFRADQVAQRRGHVGAPLGRSQFQQVGNVGGVKRRHQLARFFAVAILDRVEHGRQIFGLQPVVLIVAGLRRLDHRIFEIIPMHQGFGHIAALAHGAPYCPVPVTYRRFRPCPPEMQ